MRGYIETEKPLKGRWATGGEGRLPKAEGAGIGGSPAIRTFYYNLSFSYYSLIAGSPETTELTKSS
jgi:hypothetical protein